MYFYINKNFKIDPALLQKCFSSDNFVTLENGSQIPIMDLKQGNIVKAVDSNGNLVNSEIISILHKQTNSTSKFNFFILNINL